jgi:hypothetical protein
VTDPQAGEDSHHASGQGPSLQHLSGAIMSKVVRIHSRLPLLSGRAGVAQRAAPRSAHDIYACMGGECATKPIACALAMAAHAGGLALAVNSFAADNERLGEGSFARAVVTGA